MMRIFQNLTYCSTVLSPPSFKLHLLTFMGRTELSDLAVTATTEQS